jgi:hypothetical protein
MERQLVSEEELISILNAGLSKYEDYKDCHFMEGVVKLDEPDDEGCNWATVYLRGVCADRRYAYELVADAKKNFNIK